MMKTSKNGGEVMEDIMIIYNNCSEVGIKNRTITEGREIRSYMDGCRIKR